METTTVTQFLQVRACVGACVEHRAVSCGFCTLVRHGAATLWGNHKIPNAISSFSETRKFRTSVTAGEVAKVLLYEHVFSSWMCQVLFGLVLDVRDMSWFYFFHEIRRGPAELESGRRTLGLGAMDWQLERVALLCNPGGS